MTYQDNFLNHINDIIELIKTNKITGENEALEKFDNYLDLIQNIGSFDITNWRQDWRKKVWALGVEFKTRNPNEFLSILDTKLNLPTVANKEVLLFIRSEIAFNFLPDNLCKKELEKLIEIYPLNSEFRHTLGHFYGREEEHLLSIAEYKLALKIEPTNRTYLKSRYNSEHSYLSNLITHGKYQVGKDYVKAVFAENFYKEIDVNYHNGLVDFQARFNDILIFQNQIQKLETEFKDKMNEELSTERKRIIEVLGFFSAIVAFILSTVSIAKSFPFIQAIYFIIALGLVLILFAVALSTLFNRNKVELLKDKNFWILMVSIVSLFLFFITTDVISNIVKSIIE